MEHAIFAGDCEPGRGDAVERLQPVANPVESKLRLPFSEFGFSRPPGAGRLDVASIRLGEGQAREPEAYITLVARVDVVCLAEVDDDGFADVLEPFECHRLGFA